MKYASTYAGLRLTSTGVDMSGLGSFRTRMVERTDHVEVSAVTGVTGDGSCSAVEGELSC